MVVTRISHICPTLCDRCILIPLATALLNINKSFDENNENSSESVISSGDDIVITVSIFHSFVSLCPLQHPLQSSLQRSGVGKTIIHLCLYLLAEKREHHLLPIVKEFCFLFFQNSSDASNLAVQLHDIIVTPTINSYSMDSTGKISIYKRIESLSEKNAMPNSRSQRKYKHVRTASDLAARLGINRNDLDGTIPIISSPSDLITALSSEERTHNSLQLLSNNDPNSIEEMIAIEIESESGQDVNAILSMAVRAAQSYEMATAKSSVDSMPFRDISPNTRIVNNLLSKGQGQGQVLGLGWSQSGRCSDENEKFRDDEVDSDDEDEDDDEENRNRLGLLLRSGGESGHKMLEVGLRSRHTAELLLLSEKTMHKNNQKTNKKNNNNSNSQKLSVSNDIEEIYEKDNLISELFIYCLQSFLGVAKSSNLISENISGQYSLLSHLKGQSSSINSAVSSINSSSNSSIQFNENPEISPKNVIYDNKSKIIVKNSLSGLVLVFLQSHIPMDKLLQGGKRNTNIYSRRFLIKKYSFPSHRGVFYFLFFIFYPSIFYFYLLTEDASCLFLHLSIILLNFKFSIHDQRMNSTVILFFPNFIFLGFKVIQLIDSVLEVFIYFKYCSGLCVFRWGYGEIYPYPPMARCGRIRAIRSYAYGPFFTSQNYIFIFFIYYLFIYLFFIYDKITFLYMRDIALYLLIYLFIYLFIYLLINLFIYLSIYLCSCLSTYIYIHCHFHFCIFIYIHIYICLYLLICIFIYICIYLYANLQINKYFIYLFSSFFYSFFHNIQFFSAFLSFSYNPGSCKSFRKTS